MGVNPNFVISATFMIGAALAALAGVMMRRQLRQRALLPWASSPGLKAFTAAVLGGIGNLGRRHGRRRAAGPHRSTGRRLHRRPDRRRVRLELPGRVRLHRADPRADVASVGPAWANVSPTAPEESACHGHSSQPSTVARTIPNGRPRRSRCWHPPAGACSAFVIGTAGGNYWVRVLDIALLYVHAGAGPEHRGRLRRPAGPGLHRVLRGGRLPVRAARVRRT